MIHFSNNFAGSPLGHNSQPAPQTSAVPPLFSGARSMTSNRQRCEDNVTLWDKAVAVAVLRVHPLSLQEHTLLEKVIFIKRSSPSSAMRRKKMCLVPQTDTTLFLSLYVGICDSVLWRYGYPHMTKS